jgi:hypothetical protein
VILEAGGGAGAAVANLRSAIESQAAANAPLLVRLLRQGERNTLFAAIDPDELSGASGSLLTTAGLGYDRGDNGVFSTELAATHLLAAVAAGDDAALDLLTNRSGTLNLTTREIIQRRLVDSGHYRGTVDGVFGPATSRAIVDYRTSSRG